MKQLSLKQIALDVGGVLIGEDVLIKSLSTSSKEIGEGCLFVPLVGERFDGHDFIPSAIEHGAVACLSHKNDVLNLPTIQVENTEVALGVLAAAYKSRLSVKTVAITGSVGKTTTKEMVSALLSQKDSVLKTEGNLNNQIGLPLTLLRLEDSHRFAVLEMGMSGFGEIRYLTGLAKPDIAVISNIGVSHMEFLGSREGILKAKLEIAEGLSENGLLILNGDEPLLWKLKGSLPHTTLYFGRENPDCDCFCEKAEEDGLTTKVTLRLGDAQLSYTLNTLGLHNVTNSLAAVLVAQAFGLDFEQIKQGFVGFQNAKMRQNIFVKNGITIIEDCYNASPDSMKAALSVLKKMPSPRVAVLGAMGELGTFSREGHEDCGAVAAQSCDILLCLGEEGRFYQSAAVAAGMKQAYHFQTHGEIAEFLKENIGASVLVKGSRFMEMERVLALYLGEDE